MEIHKSFGSHRESLLDGEANQLHEDQALGPDVLSGEEGEGHGSHDKDPNSKIGILGSAMNIANTIIGAGILALPVVLANYGLVMGASIIVLSCILTYFSCCLLLKAKNLSRHSKYITISKHCFNDKGLWLVKIIIIVNNIGVSILYLIIFSNVGSNLMSAFNKNCPTREEASEEGEENTSSNIPLYCEGNTLKVLGAMFIFPFIFSKDMSKLSKLSVFGVVAIATFSIITVGYYLSTLTGDDSSNVTVNFLPAFEDPIKALASITSVFLAFTFQFNFFPVYKSLENPTDERMRKVTKTALLIVLTIFLSVATAGYLIFGNATNDLLINFTAKRLGKPLFVVMNLAFVISSTATFPLMFFAARNNIYGAIVLIRKGLSQKNTSQAIVDENEDINGNYTTDSTSTNGGEIQLQAAKQDAATDFDKFGFSKFGYVVYVVILYGIIVMCAIFIPDIETVFHFVGSTAANSINFILPSAFYLSLASKKGKYRGIATIILVIGCVMCVVGLTTATIQLIEK